MELREAIRSRRSIRQFLAKPVSEELIEDLIASALWAPSWSNSQPWEIVVVTGEKLEQFVKTKIPVATIEELKLSFAAVATDLNRGALLPAILIATSRLI